jgi:hypothetical protein
MTNISHVKDVSIAEKGQTEDDDTEHLSVSANDEKNAVNPA